MRRRHYLRSLAGLAGVSGLAAGANAARSGDDPAAARQNGTTASAATTETTVPAAPADTATPGSTATATATGTDSDEFAPRGRVELPTDTPAQYRAAEAVATGDGEHAFVATLDGFHVVDLSAPADPAVVARREGILADREGGPLSGIMDLKYDRGHLLVAGPANAGPELESVVLFDVSDPADPSLRTFYETNYAIHNCDLQGRHAYLTTGTALVVVDMARADPAPVGRWSVVDYDERYEDVQRLFRDLHDVAVQGDRAYLAYWDAGSWILDVSDPADPSYLGHVADHSLDELLDLAGADGAPFLEPPGNDHYTRASDDGSLLAVGRESWDDETGDGVGGPSGIDLYDASDPADPDHLSTIEPPAPPAGAEPTRDGYWTTAHNFDIVGDYLYSSWYRGGVKIHDVSDPADPVEVAAWADGERASFWTAQAAVPGEYVIASSHGDPSDREAPGALYVFPDPTDNPVAATPAPDSDAFSNSTTAAPTSGGTTGATAAPSGNPATPTDSDTAVSRGTTEDVPTADDPRSEPAGTTASGAEGPGFGPLAALAGLGLGARRLLDDGEE